MTDLGPAVELSGVHKNFGSVQALSGLTLKVDIGEVVALLGPNGAGKTTAISLMLGLRKPTSGRVGLLGRDPRDPTARTRVGVMLQESGVPGTLRVRELVDLFRSYYPSPLPATEVIERAGLVEKADALMNSLSGGQRQRLYFALAICGDPLVLFLDEPSVGMDVATRRNFWEQVRELALRGRALVLTTHYLEEADALADRIAVIDHGQLIAEGSPTAIKAQIAVKRVRFESAGKLGADVFRNLPVRELAIDGHQISLVSVDAESVLEHLFSQKVKISNLEVVGAGLEEAFLSLTQPVPLGGSADAR